jgi:serine/threonine protein phosphatase PrpC
VTPLDRMAIWTHRGGRKSNQDAAIALALGKGRELLAVADGMGGQSAGAVASRLALETLVASLRTGAPLTEAVRAANAAVFRTQEERPECQGMGTTLVALLRTGRRYVVANVGDSRAYRVADAVERLTRDHSFLEEALARGELTREEAVRSPWRHAVTRALGLSADVEVDTFGPNPIRSAHYVLLCSDGLTNALSDRDLENQFRGAPTAEVAAERLGHAALAGRCSDNVTAAVMHFDPPLLARLRGVRAGARRSAGSSVWRWRVVEALIVLISLLLVAAAEILLTRVL